MSFSESVGDSQISGDFSQLENLISELDAGYYVDIGILGDGEVTPEGDSLAEIGAKHEFGSIADKLPQRSFIKMPLEAKQSEISQKVESGMQAKLEAGDVEGIFRDIGIAGEAAIGEAFDTGGFGTWKGLSERTKDQKGSDAILIDEGHLRRSITSEVGSGNT